MVAELLAVIALAVVALAEGVHALRCRRLAALAFGPTERPAYWARSAPLIRSFSVAAVTWGLTTLWLLPPKEHRAKLLPEHQLRHLVLVLDVSPSMRLQDAGQEGKLSRQQRAAVVLQSLFDRIPLEYYRLSIVACYNGAIPVVVDTTDMEVVRNILTDLPMQYAFPTGKTDIFAGLKEAARIAHPWRPNSAAVILVSDGDTVPGTGMPKMPASVHRVLVVGVGDARAGSFIDGRQSKQEAATLRQVAVRLHGHYHNANEKHISSEVVSQIHDIGGSSPFAKLTRREYALLATLFGAAGWALLPLALHFLGTRWRPGTSAA